MSRREWPRYQAGASRRYMQDDGDDDDLDADLVGHGKNRNGSSKATTRGGGVKESKLKDEEGSDGDDDSLRRSGRRSKNRLSNENSQNGDGKRRIVSEIRPQGRTRNVGRAGSRQHSLSDDDDNMDDAAFNMKTLTSPTSRMDPKESILLEDEKIEDDGDKDEFRLANRIAKEKTRNDIHYQAQSALWNKFRISFPVSLRTFLSTATIFAFRARLMKQKKLITAGIPIHLRRDVWEILAGARTLPERLEKTNLYDFYLKQTPPSKITKEIAGDAKRALRGHLRSMTKTGQNELIRILSAFSVRSPQIGYCSALSHIGAFLLLFYPEERAFFMLCAIVDIVLPPNYFTNSLLGSRADAQLIKILVFQRFPKLHTHLTNHQQNVYLIALRYLMPLFLTTLPMHVVIRVWDCAMLFGGEFFLSVCLALFALHAKPLLALKNEEDLLEYVDKIPSDDLSMDPEKLLELALSDKCTIGKEEWERREIERKIMEAEYMKDLAYNNKSRVEDEQEKKRLEDERKRKLDEEEESLTYGTEMWKVGQQGSIRKTTVALHIETIPSKNPAAPLEKRYAVRWESKKKALNDSRIWLESAELYWGMSHGNFLKRSEAKKKFSDKENISFSIIDTTRSLDLICTTGFDFDQWRVILDRIPMKYKQRWDTSSSVGGGAKKSTQKNGEITADNEEEKSSRRNPISRASSEPVEEKPDNAKHNRLALLLASSKYDDSDDSDSSKRNKGRRR